MPLKLTPAGPADAARIAEIHMAAFGSNAMLLAQFPTPEVRKGLQESIRLKALADIEDPKISVLVVRDLPSNPAATARVENGSSNRSGVKEITSEAETEEDRGGKVVAFAKWSHPTARDDGYEETPWIWPPGTDLEILDGWARVAEEAQEQAVGDKPCYRLTFMGTDPAYERRGAASMMVRWGLDQCRKKGVLAYIESTLDAAAFYEKLGFTAFSNLSLEYKIAGQYQAKVYREISFIHRPSSV
ncbi:putative GNAT family acetyltransferase [Xylariaceae sp. FL1651]|nr:putative GNAT family acetyltransferase [Xylariaceae sp. FL1651]